MLTYFLAVYAGSQEKILKQQIADSRATQRAFIVSSGYDVEFHGELGEKRYRFLVGWENRGNTPTRNAKIVLTCPKSRDHVADPLAVAVIEQSMLAHRSIGPKEATPGGNCEFAVPFITDVKNGKLIIYLVAGIVYDDVFGASHVTLYCREIFDVAGPIGVPMEQGTSFFDSPCEDYNCTDEECGDMSKFLAR